MGMLLCISQSPVLRRCLLASCSVIAILESLINFEQRVPSFFSLGPANYMIVFLILSLLLLLGPVLFSLFVLPCFFSMTLQTSLVACPVFLR